MASVKEYADMTNAAYDGPDGSAGKAPEGWTQIDKSPTVPGNYGSENGFYAAAYKNNETGEIVIANRGSRPSVEGLKQDWFGSDVDIAKQSPGSIPKAFDEADDFARKVRSENPGAEINFTGHSLGGAEAQVQAARLDTGAKAFTFGAPGAAFAVTPSQAKAAEGLIINYALPGDPVAAHGEHIGQRMALTPNGPSMLRDVAAGKVGGVIANAALGLLKAVASPAGLTGLLAAPAVALGIVIGPLIALLGLAAANHPMSNYMSALASMSAPGGGRPQSRITDMHVCPMVTGVVPHVGGPIAMGCFTVFVGKLPAARVSDMAVCVGPPDIIAMGSGTVFIGKMPAARIGDMTAHGGVITVGYPTVLTGG